MVSELGPYRVADGPDGTTSLGATVLEAHGDQLAVTDSAAADAAYRDAAARQRSFAAVATVSRVTGDRFRRGTPQAAYAGGRAINVSPG
jgi:hypothetical protein